MLLFAALNANPIFCSKSNVSSCLISHFTSSFGSEGATLVVFSWSTFQLIEYSFTVYDSIGLSLNHFTLLCFWSSVSTIGVRMCQAHSTREGHTSGLFSSLLFGYKQSKFVTLVSTPSRVSMYMLLPYAVFLSFLFCSL
jgi:hypothetical protein